MVAHSDDSLASRGVQQQRITIVFLALAWVFILIRVWTRTYVINNFGWDDSTMVLAGVRTGAFPSFGEHVNSRSAASVLDLLRHGAVSQKATIGSARC